MRTVIFIPPLKKESGGLAALCELAVLLARQGFEVAVTSVEGNRGLAGVDGAIPRLPWNSNALKSTDIWLVPEGWPNAIAAGAACGAQTLVYVQNWIFMMSALPENVEWKQLPVRYLAVSRPVDWFCRQVLGLDVEAVLPPSIHPVFFSRGARPAHIRVAYMPRKNRALAGQIRKICEACLAGQGVGVRVEFVAIHNQPREEVAKTLMGCHIFMCTGFPEGFGLPPAEAMACGCVPVGFSGFGGFEYMRNPEPFPIQGLHNPPFALEGKPEIVLNGGNGLFVSDGDVLGAGRALAHAVLLAHAGGATWEGMARNCRQTARAYTVEFREKAVARIWTGLTGGSGSVGEFLPVLQ